MIALVAAMDQQGLVGVSTRWMTAGLIAGIVGCEGQPPVPTTHPIRHGCVDTTKLIWGGDHNPHHCATGQVSTIEHGRDIDDGFVLICRCPRSVQTDGGR